MTDRTNGHALRAAAAEAVDAATEYRNRAGIALMQSTAMVGELLTQAAAEVSPIYDEAAAAVRAGRSYLELRVAMTMPRARVALVEVEHVTERARVLSAVDIVAGQGFAGRGLSS